MKQIALIAMFALATALTGCTAQQGGLTEQDIGDIEFVGGIAAGEGCHAGAANMNEGQLVLMRASINGAIATVQQKGAGAIQEALAPVKQLDPLRAAEISGLVDRMMKRVPEGASTDIATRIVVAILKGCDVGMRPPPVS